MNIMKFIAGTCAPDASPECWEIFDVGRQEREHRQNQISMIFSLDVACFITAVAFIAVYFYLKESKCRNDE